MDYFKIQLKGRLTFDKKYLGKDIHICFNDLSNWYIYEHDLLLETFLKKFSQGMALSHSWEKEGKYTWNSLSKEILQLLENCKVQ